MMIPNIPNDNRNTPGILYIVDTGSILPTSTAAMNTVRIVFFFRYHVVRSVASKIDMEGKGKYDC
jgi:hypothetical protein